MAMQASYIHLSSKDVPILSANRSLLLNVEERIVTLLEPGYIYAQCRFPRRAFRLLVLLLKAPFGADYEELLAGLHCSETIFRKLAQASSHEQVETILAPQIALWHQRLEQVAQQEKGLLEKELKVVRRVAKERGGVDMLLQKHGFALCVKGLNRKGYLLSAKPQLTGEHPTQAGGEVPGMGGRPDS